MIPSLEIFDSSSGENLLVSTARFSLRRGIVSTTFFYSDGWLADGTSSYAIDPALPLAPGPQHVQGMPGAFRDSAPDRWGRTLIERDRREDAARDGSALRQLDEVDYLVGVFDQTREGSLRFRESGGEFLAASASIPPLVQLPKLLHASREVANDEAGRAEIKELLAAGSGSLGGARPKASVCDGDRLLLAKFSHKDDEWDVMAWEKTMLDLACDAGIPVPASRLVRIGRECVLLLERFDREDSLLEGRRIPYMSAMTALESSDGERRDYAELAEAVAQLSTKPTAELEALFACVAFSVAVGNTDDHLRNWGFLRNGKGWALAPLFDVNPTPYESVQRVTTIAGESREREVQGLRDLAAYCGLSPDEARRIVSKVVAAVEGWRNAARRNGCPEREHTLFAPLFTKKLRELRDAFGL